MKKSILKIHPGDNVLVALRDLSKGEVITFEGSNYLLQEDIPAKHKFSMEELEPGREVKMYGVLVGRAKEHIHRGARISTTNLQHATDPYELSKQRKTAWRPPDISDWSSKTFLGYHRTD